MKAMRMTLCIVFFCFSGACNIFASDMSGLSFSLSKDGDAIKLNFSNGGKRDVYAALPFGVSLDNSFPGVELVIRDSFGNRKRLCAFINPSRTSERLVVKSGGEYSERLEIEYIKTIFCLEPGPYSILGIYHNVLSKQDSFSLGSNSVEITIR